MIRTLPILLLWASAGCRVSPDDTAEPRSLYLGTVELGAEFSLRQTFEGIGPSSTMDGPGLKQISISDDDFTLLWHPTDEGTVTGVLHTTSGEEITLLLNVDPSIDHWPEPIATETGLDSLGSLPATGLGDAIFSAESSLPIAIDPVSGHAYFGDATQGRAWRVDAFYNHPTWGLWVATDRETKEGWVQAPECFTDQAELLQDGTCDGTEVDINGVPPRGWRYFHGGFAGDGELSGLSDLVADPQHGRVWAFGNGWIQAIDTDLFSTPDEGVNSYSFTQVIENSLIPIDPKWSQPMGVRLGGRLWIVEPTTGDLGVIDLPVDDGPWTEITLDHEVHQFTTDGQSLFLLGAETLKILTPANSSELTPETPISAERVIDLPTKLLNGQATDMVAYNGEAWVAWGDALVHVSADEVSVHPLPEGGSIQALALDRVTGGNAEDLEMLYLVGETNEEGWLRSATLNGGWLGSPITLVDRPLDLGYSPEPHDLYIVYGAGSAGCDGDWADYCQSKTHPPMVQVFYNPYSLVPPTSTGHPLNLFLSPIIESPKDAAVGTDYTSGRVCTPNDKPSAIDPLDLGCCALAWSLEQRLLPNVAYFEFLANLGTDTDTVNDDPTLAWGINPSVLRQAWECANSEVLEHQQAGQAMYAKIANLVGDRSTLTTWTHTALNQGGGTLNHDWWMSLAFEDGVDYTIPLDTQEEYALLHESLSLISTPELINGPISGIDLSSTIGAGNSLDAVDLVDPVVGWPSENPSWVRPIRDGSLAADTTARNAYYFLSAGTDPSIGTNTYRKKELWPIDVRDRAVVTQLPEAVVDFGQEGTSGLYNLPGLSWEIGTLVNLSEGGAYRETQMYGQAVTARNWEYVFRLLRRAIATSTASDTKSWYQHIFDVTNPSGLYSQNSRVPEVGTIEGDVTAEAILRINAELVTPGYARWSLPEDIVEEAISSDD